MAEIKSTLDIIMEKAKKFSVTEEEKKAFKRRELEGKVKGLIQKYLDGLVDMERLKEDVEVLRKDEAEDLDHLFRQEAVDRVQPGQINTPLLEILSSVAGMDTGPVKKLLDDFDSRMEHERTKQEEVLREELRQKGISGSAVIPNLYADEDWRKVLSEISQTFKEALKSLA